MKFLLENYTFLWNLSGKKWLKEWTTNVDSMGTTDRTAGKTVGRAIQLRERRAVKPLVRLQKQQKDGDRLIYAKALYQFLEELDVPSSLQKLSISWNKWDDWIQRNNKLIMEYFNGYSDHTRRDWNMKH